MIGSHCSRPLLGAEALGGLLLIATGTGTGTGILTALFINNGGGVCDNATKYPEAASFAERSARPTKLARRATLLATPRFTF
jgi:Na+/H+-translocating membrane pyrophosphatase